MPQLIEFAVIRHVRFWNDSKNHSAGYDNGAVVKLVRAANRRTYDGGKPKVRGFACDAEKLGFKEKTVIPASACGVNVPDVDARLSVRTIVLRRKNL